MRPPSFYFLHANKNAHATNVCTSVSVRLWNFFNGGSTLYFWPKINTLKKENHKRCKKFNCCCLKEHFLVHINIFMITSTLDFYKSKTILDITKLF